MSPFFADSLRNIWPFSMLESSNDLRESKELVQRLSVPESTKNFVFAIKVPEHDSTVYLLSTHNLSERSATDAECLIREIRPDAVVAQVDNSYFVEESQVEESLLESGSSDSIPTSAFKVLKQCFSDKINKEKYETVARILVLKEIFGTGLNGHLYAAKRVAREIGSSFMVMDSPSVNISAGGNMQGRRANSLISKESGSKRFQISNDAQEQMLKLLSSHITQLSKELSPSIQSDTHEVPPVARSIYAFLVDLHNIFSGLPSIRKALVNARKMLSDVNRGESIDTEVISELYLFQIAVEGLRIALNNAGRIPIGILNRNKVQFSQLSSQDKSYALMADHLRSQAKNFKNIVAVVDASNLAGLRKHWNTCVPQQVKDMSMVQDFGNEENSNDESVTHICISASPFFKIVSFQVPTSLNLFLTQTHKAMTFAFTKVPGFASSGAKSTSLVKASLFTESIRAVVIQNIIFSAEKTSFSTMRASLYQIMRKSRAKPIGSLPLVTFGVSLATLAGLLVYEDKIECVAMSLPSAPSIAKLGRGIQNLHEASLEVRRRDNNRIQNAIEVLRQRLKNFMLQRRREY